MCNAGGGAELHVRWIGFTIEQSQHQFRFLCSRLQQLSHLSVQISERMRIAIPIGIKHHYCIIVKFGTLQKVLQRISVQIIEMILPMHLVDHSNGGWWCEQEY